MESNNTFISTLVLTLLTTAPSFHTTNAQDCNPSDPLPGQDPPPGTCDPTGSDCCVAGESNTTYTCSPQVTDTTSAIMTVNDFEQGGDGGGASSCDQTFHTNDELVVALSTGWFDSGSRCGHDIVISANGLTTTAKVVDECDSRHGCDEEHAYQKPCRFNVVDASSGVWDALGLSSSDGETTITWSDA